MQEGFFKVEIALGRDVVVLQVVLPVKQKIFGLHNSVLAVGLVAADDDWN